MNLQFFLRRVLRNVLQRDAIRVARDGGNLLFYGTDKGKFLAVHVPSFFLFNVFGKNNKHVLLKCL